MKILCVIYLLFFLAALSEFLDAMMDGKKDFLRPHSDEAESDYWITNGNGENRKFEDEYLLGDVIGRGASSTVYKCLRKGRTEWACKILKKKQINKKTFQQQISVLLGLKHPNIIELKEVFETADEIQLILELAQGGELFERIVERGCYTEADAAHSIRQILNGLQYLHEHDIIHGDLKPENLLYKTKFENSELKIADFGMSGLLSNEQIALNKSFGTLGHCAPELLLEKDFNSSVDLWSLGVLLYTMLCGFEPFLDERGDVATIKNITEGDFTFPSPWWDDISDSAKELISRLLSLDPNSRSTAEEALNHPWTMGITTFSLHMNEAVIKLREFNAKRKFRIATKAVIAAQRALNLLTPKYKRRNNEGESCLCDPPLDRDTIKNCDKDKRSVNCTVCDDVDPTKSNDSSQITDGRSIEKSGIKHSSELAQEYKENCFGLS